MREVTMTVKVKLSGKPEDAEVEDFAGAFGAAIDSKEFWEDALAGSGLDDGIQVKAVSVRL